MMIVDEKEIISCIYSQLDRQQQGRCNIFSGYTWYNTSVLLWNVYQEYPVKNFVYNISPSTIIHVNQIYSNILIVRPVSVVRPS